MSSNPIPPFVCTAPERPSFTIAFQPIVDISQGGMLFAQEALLRGPDGESAAQIIGRIAPGELYAFDHAVRCFAIQLAQDIDLPGRISLNILGGAISDPVYGLRHMLRFVQKIRFPTDRLIFEITEHEQVGDMEHARSILAACRRRNILIALDDFGAGYNGLNSLIDLQPDLVKLDMGLIRGIEMDLRRQSVVRHCTTLARELGATLVAEGVETGAEAETLNSLGLALMQGFWFARPKSAVSARSVSGSFC